MAKYKKRADGRYCTSIMIDIDGEKKKKYVYGKTIKEVDDKIAELRAQSNIGRLPNGKEISVMDCAHIWLNVYKKPTVAPATYKGYRIAVEDHIIPAFDGRKMSELRPNMLQELLNKLCAGGQVQTARKVKIALCGTVKTAIKERYILENVADGLKLPPYKPKEKRGLTEEETDAFLNAELKDRERAYVDLLYYTGVRKGEALALTADDIDLENKTITVRKTLSLLKNRGEIRNNTKTDAGMRTLPIPDKLIGSLSKVVTEGPLFKNHTTGEYLTMIGFRRMWETIINECSQACESCREVTSHTFRHNYATKLYYAGVDVKTAQYLLGHNDIRVTLSFYTHMDKNDTRKLGAVVNNIF